MPDPIIEKQREPIVYADATEEKTGPDYAMREIRRGHYVSCTPEQASKDADNAEKANAQ